MIAMFKILTGGGEAQTPSATIKEDFTFEAGLMVQNGQVKRVQGTAHDKESEKVMGAWAEVKMGNRIHYTTVAFEKIDLEELVNKALAKAVKEINIGSLTELEQYISSRRTR